MKTQVIGMGVVGKAQAYLMFKHGHEVSGYDVLPITDVHYCKIEANPVRDIDITFICVNETRIEEAIQTLICAKVKGLYVIKSTTPPNTTSSLMHKYGSHICHNPEFLRQAHAFEDILSPDRVIIGECCKKHGGYWP